MLRPVQLNAECARVLGSLVEKSLTTPQRYPLTLSALQAACNQTSNREPVVSYDEATVLSALDSLKERRLVRFVLPSHGRSALRYRQVLDEVWGLDARQCAILAVLMLRGPQTVGELRLRTERMTHFDGLDEVEHELDLLGGRDEPLARNVGRRPGQKEERWATPLVPEAAADAVPPRVSAADAPVTPRLPDEDPDDGSDDVRAEVSRLRSEVAELRRELEDLRDSLGG
jgi:hypothetical protein